MWVGGNVCVTLTETDGSREEWRKKGRKESGGKIDWKVEKQIMRERGINCKKLVLGLEKQNKDLEKDKQ